MFGDRSAQVVSFNSQLSTARSQSSTNVQTTQIAYDESPAQTAETKTAETQTATADENVVNIDHERLAKFLFRVTPSVLEALDESYGTDAFDDYEPSTDEESVASTRLLEIVRMTAGEPDSQTKITDMCWSIGGGTLAVSYGVTYHQTWCEHLSKIELYERTRRGGTLAGEPSRTLETNGCVTTMAYHPTEPSILAVGLFNGDVVVWNLREDASTAPATVVCTHEDSVTRVYWNARAVNGGDASLLTSSGKDGHILAHKMTANYSIADVYKRFRVAKEHERAESSRPRSGTRERAVEPGSCVVTFDFSSKDPRLFVVGTLSGGLYKCTMDPIHVPPPVQGDDAPVDPVIGEYDKYEGGSVTCVRCSPTRNIFVAAGTDKEIRIYDFEERHCLHSIPSEDTIVGLTWMTWNRDILATYGVGPTIGLYNVADGRLVTNATFQSADRQNSSCLCVSPKENLVAIGDTRGNLEIWKVPRGL